MSLTNQVPRFQILVNSKTSISGGYQIPTVNRIIQENCAIQLRMLDELEKAGASHQNADEVSLLINIRLKAISQISKLDARLTEQLKKYIEVQSMAIPKTRS